MIFISYRKEDSSHLALSLADKLVECYGTELVFLDRQQIKPGENWRVEIDSALSKALVVLAVIGSRWLTTYDKYGQRRIDRDDDVLYYELSMALFRQIKIIPIYLDDMEPLPPEAFPDRLTGLAKSQGIKFDMLRDLPLLLDMLDKIPGLNRKKQPLEVKEKRKPPKKSLKPWCIPDSIGMLFKGRTEELQELRERFLKERATPTDNSVQRQLIFGLGGIGKTRLAIEYAWEYQEYYTALLFTVADTPIQLRRSIAELSVPEILNLPEWIYQEEERRMAAVIGWFSENPGWLLIIDNADDKKSVEAVQQLLSRLRGGHVLITSRRSSWSKTVTKKELDVLTLEGATAFLMERTKDERRMTPQDESVAKELAIELGGLALALEQAGAYIQNQEGGLSLADYLARWRERSKNVSSWYDECTMHYPRSVANTWETTVSSLSPGALTLFRILSWFTPEPIPRSIVSTPGALESIKIAVKESGLAIGEIDPEQALIELISYSMTRKVNEQGIACVGLHRVVLQIMRDRMPDDAKASTIVAAADLIVQYAPKYSNRPENWMEWRLLISHAEMIWDVMIQLQENFWNIELMKMRALYFMGQNLKAEGVPVQREVLRLVKLRFPSNHPEVFLAMNDLAIMLDSSAEEEIKELLETSMDGRKSILGEESYEFGESLHNYGCFLGNCGRYTEAEEYLRRAIAIRNKIGETDVDSALRSKAVLVDILVSKGEILEAESLAKSLLEEQKGFLGDNHPQTLESLSSLAWFLEQHGDYLNAEINLRQIYETTFTIFGSTHPLTIKAIDNLASFFYRIDDCNQAEALFKQALESNERKYGRNHYHTLCSMNILALFYMYLGDIDHSEPLFEEACRGMICARGRDNPESLNIKTNLAEALQKAGRNKEAEELFMEVLKINQNIRGNDHQLTLFSMNRLAIFYSEIDQEEKAEQLYRSSIEGLEKKRGRKHRDTMTVSENLASLLRERGNLIESEALYKNLVEINEQMNGTDHLVTLNYINKLAIFYYKTDNYELAEKRFKYVLEGKKRIQGTKHPDTLLILSNLANLLLKKHEYRQSEELYREVLEINEREFGPEHNNTLSSLLSLADSLEKAGKNDESLKLREKFIARKSVKSDSASLGSLRNLALQFLLNGDYERAEQIQRHLLEKNFNITSTYCHLARILILTNRETEARELIDKAIKIKNQAKSFIIFRIIFFKTLFSLLDGEIITSEIVEMKQLMTHESVFNEWKIMPVLVHFKNRLNSVSYKFLIALINAINDRKELYKLDRFQHWQTNNEHTH